VAIAATPGISDGRMTEIVAGELKEGMLFSTLQDITLQNISQKAVSSK
jgi:hypothetical protein